MSLSDDNKRTQRVERPIPRNGPAKSPFAGGRAELMSNPAYQLFREHVRKDPLSAARMMKECPECVVFAARMLGDPDTLLSIDAGVALLSAAEQNVPIPAAFTSLKSALLYDENDQVRLAAAKVFNKLALNGQDISEAFIALDSAHVNDRSEAVRLTAEMALIAAGQPTQ